MLSQYALIGLEEAKAHLSIAGPAKDALVEEIVNRVTDEIEGYLGRQIVTRGSLTEFHTLQADGEPVYAVELRTLEWPIVTVTSVHEDLGIPRTYGAAALLASDGSKYDTVKPKGILRRLETAGNPVCWATGYRAIKVVYSAGAATTAAVPAAIKSAAFRYAGLLWGEATRGDFGVSGRGDTLGNYTRFSPAMLTPDIRAALNGERQALSWISGERDA